MECRTVRVYLCFLFLTIIGAINGCRQSVQYLHRLKIKVAQMEEWTQILLYFGKDLVRLLEEVGNQETCQQGLLASTAKSRLSIPWNSSRDISGSSFQYFFKMDLYLYFKYHILRVLLLLILVLTADWAPCGDGCQRRGGHWGGAAGRWSGRPRGAPPPSRSPCRPRYNLQFHPARGKSLIIVLQDKNEALPKGWMKKRQFWSTLSEGVELMTGFDWYNVATIFCEKKMSPIWVIIFQKILKSVKITAILVKFSKKNTLPQNFHQNWWQKETQIGRNFLSPELVILSSLKNSPISSNHQNVHQNWWKKNTKLSGIMVTRIGEIFVT